MSERSMARQMGAVIRSSRDAGYHELGRDVKRRVKRGDGVILNDRGEITIIDREALRRERNQARQSFQDELSQDISLQVIDVIGENPIASRLFAGLNGDSARARKLFETKAREFATVGRISQAEIIRHEDSSRSPVYGVQTKELDVEKRLKAYFSRKRGVFELRVLCKSQEDERGRDALRADGYLPPRLGRGARRG